MQTTPVRDLRPLAIVAVLGLIGGCVLFGSRQTTDENLVRLVDRLSAQLAGSTVLASSIVAAAAILAAVIIPAITVICLLRAANTGSRNPAPKPESSAHPAIAGCDTRALPEKSTKTIAPDVTGESFERRANISAPDRTRHGGP